MVSIKRQVASVTSSLFLVLIGVRYYIQAWELLSLYLNGNGAQELVLFGRNGSGNFTILQSQISSSHNEWGRQEQHQQQSHQKSPACHPHFRFTPHESNKTRAWSEDTKFKRMYFYHARKAGGTSLANYFSMVARHHGLEFEHAEWVEAEEPGTHELPTFYVTHLRDPVDRSISHFKYQGRWDCRDLTLRSRDEFIPTEENAMKLETWNTTGGHSIDTCRRYPHFSLGMCAVNCYTQWFSGACPEYNRSIHDQYLIAKTKLFRYNFVVVLEWLWDPEYVSAVESFFGVPGVTQKRSAYCERAAHTANKLVPLTINNRTLNRLTELNQVDINLYNEITKCDTNGDNERRYVFPQLDEDRFDNTSSIQVHYSEFMDWKKNRPKKRRRKREKSRASPEVEVDTSVEADGG